MRKLNSTMASIEMIIGATAMIPAVDPQSKKRIRRTTSGVLPFIGEISKVLFGTTENDVHQQQIGVNHALTLANINAKELNYLGSVLKKAIVIHKENTGINLEAVMANTAAVQNISMAFGRYTVRKRIQEQLISRTRKLELISLRLDVQFQTLLSDVIALTTGVLRPTLVTFQEMLQFKAILEGQVIDKQFQLPSFSQIFKMASLYTRPILFGNVLILTLRVPLLCRSKSFSLFKSKTFPLPLHGHFSQLVGLPTYLIVSNTYIRFPNADDARRCEYMSKLDTCQLDVATQPLQPTDCLTALVLNSVSGVKAYCHFKLFIQSVPSPPHIDHLLHGHYILDQHPQPVCHLQEFIHIRRQSHPRLLFMFV